MRKTYLILLACCIILIGVLVYLQIDRYRTVNNGENNPVENDETLKVYVTDTEQTEASVPESLPPVSGAVTESETEPEQEPVVESTLDFNVLWETNPDICAWIEIPGMNVDYPVLQCPKGNDNKYLTTALNGKYYVGGSLFTQETYNNRDFNDRVTVIYGHWMPDRSLFGDLQRVYSNPDTFTSCDDIKIYLPDEVRHYTVFAAVPFENTHITATYDFTSDYWYKSFFKRVSGVHALEACFNEEAFPEIGDRVIILSTCLNGDNKKRYLVMAVNRDDIKDNGVPIS